MDSNENLKAAMEYLDKTRQRTDATLVHKTNEQEHVMLSGPGMPTEVKVFDRDPEPIVHRFQTLVGMIDYLNSEHCKNCDKGKGIIFVEDGGIEADITYKSRQEHRATLRLEHADEYTALLSIGRGINQADLFKMLVTQLYTCLSPGLALQVKSLKVSKQNTASYEIDDSGLVSSGSESSVSVSVTGPEGASAIAKVDTEWTWKGKIFECLDIVYSIPLRLFLSIDNGELRFTFYAVGLQEIFNRARQDMIEKLSEELDAERYTVHEGQL